MFIRNCKNYAWIGKNLLAGNGQASLHKNQQSTENTNTNTVYKDFAYITSFKGHNTSSLKGVIL